MATVALIDYQKGNIKSVERALAEAGINALVTSDPAVAAAADALVMPGVGAFEDAMTALNSLGLTEVVRQRILDGVPYLGICLGMHVLFEGGTESASGEVVPGLGILPGVVDLMPREDAAGISYKVPHVGWNTAVPVPFNSSGHLGTGNSSELLVPFNSSGQIKRYQVSGHLGTGNSAALLGDAEYFYFTHSYIAPPGCENTIATTTHSIEFPSAVQYGERCFGVQFHPEKSSTAGLQLLKTWAALI